MDLVTMDTLTLIAATVVAIIVVTIALRVLKTLFQVVMTLVGLGLLIVIGWAAYSLL